jgi:hypothetical protein
MIDEISYILQGPDIFIPIRKEIQPFLSDEEVEMSHAHNPTINLTKLLKELHSDLKTVLTNGSVKYACDLGYWNNLKAVDQSIEIAEKWKIR